MGAQQSSIEELTTNEFLMKLVKDVRIDREDKFWNDLLNFTFKAPLEKSLSSSLKESVENLCSTLVVNNKSSGNFTTLVCLSIYHLQEILTDNNRSKDLNFVQSCQNNLFVIRCHCEYMVEHLHEDQIIGQFNTLPTFDGQPTVFEEMLFALTQTISFLPVSDITYYIHLEAVNIILVLSSIQMYQMKASSDSQLYMYIMNSKCSNDALSTVRILLHNYIKNDDPPAPSQSLVGWAASGLYSMLGGGSAKPKATEANELNPLANHSLLLLVVMVFHFTKENNKYRDALFRCKPGKKTEKDEEVEEKDRSFPLNFKRLYSSLSRDLHQDQTVLLLYILLHKNPSFLKFLLRQKDLEKPIVPILKVLYNADHKNAHHIYMALIVILIFTQQDEFNKTVHIMQVTDVSWYKERNLADISLGSLLVLIIIRTIQYNMVKLRDKYLHTNCLASLANMSGSFAQLHSFAAQRFITLFQHLVKQYKKLSEKLKNAESNQPEELSDLEIMEEILRMLLEILNACLSNNIAENVNVIFQLLRFKELFQMFHGNPKFQDVIQNVDTAISYFGAKVDEFSEGSLSSAEDVVHVILEAAENWPKRELKDHTLTHEVLRKINPKEAELLNDPVFKARIRFRFAGDEFPPYIVFKIFIQTNGQGMKYLCGKKVIKSSITAATDSCQLMGNRKYLDQLMMDICDDNQHEINHESDVTNLKEYMKSRSTNIEYRIKIRPILYSSQPIRLQFRSKRKYISTVDEKDALAGGKGNTWRKLTLDDVPRNHLIYDVITYLETTSRNTLFKNFIKTRGKIMPMTQSEQVDFIHYLANSKFITKSIEPSRRSRQTRDRVSRMKKLYMQEENDQTSANDRVNRNRKDPTKNYINNVEVAIDDETYNVMLKEDIDISDERWDEEGKYLFEWTRNLSFDSISLR